MKTHGSLFSGIGGFDLGFERASIKTAWQVEIDRHCRAVLARHFKEVKRYNDVKKCGKHNLEPVDVITGGFPCQDVSIAGKREGLAGERSGLWFEFHRIIKETSPRWVVVENVPGLLSSNGGEDFAVILRGLVECGYGVCWRILDSQYFGVPQRRRRVFIIGSLGNGRSAEVLFESESRAWGDPPSREAREGTSVWAVRRAQTNSNGWGVDEIAHALDSTGGDAVATVSGAVSSKWRKGTGGPAGDEAYNLISNVWQMHHASEVYRESTDKDTVPTLQERMGTGGNNVPLYGVRRLTPTECARLQAFPDDWLDGLSDSAKYRLLGNAVTVNVAEWIANRIVMSEREE